MPTVPADTTSQPGFSSAEEIFGDAPLPVIHIGLPAAMDDGPRAGIFLPSQGFTKIIDPSDAACGLVHPPRFEFNGEILKRRLQQRRSRLRDLGDNVPVITCERLAGNPYGHRFDAPLIAERLHHCLPHARILIIIREQRRLLRTLYARMVRDEGMPHSLAWLLEHSSLREIPGFSLTYLRHHGLVEHYRALFGSERVLVLPWELFEENPGDFVTRLRRFGGHSRGEPEQAVTPRPGSSKVTGRMPSLAVIRRVNRYFFYNGFNTRGWLPDGDVAAAARIGLGRTLDRLLPGFLDGRLERRFTAEVAQVTEGFFADSNRRLQAHVDVDLSAYGYEL